MEYTIDLNVWGITEGIPAKPWVNADYLMADANIQGINNALQWAYLQGYRTINMPIGNYAICYPRRIVIDKDNLTFKIIGSTFKVLYDSDSQSPLDTADRTVSQDYYNFPSSTGMGVSFLISNCYNSHLIGGKLIGERLDRSFTKPQEKAIEWTAGVQIEKGANYCSVSKCEIAFYMADGVSSVNSALGEYAEFSVNPTINDLDKVTGQLIPSTTNMVTKMISFPTIPVNTIYNAFEIIGFGFTRQTGLLTKDVGVYFYRQDDSFIEGSALHNKKIYTQMHIPKDAKKYKLVIYNETDISKVNSNTWGIHLKFGCIPHHNIIENNTIYGNHRGGIQPGGDYSIIQNNTIYNIGNGQVVNGVSIDFYGKPTFNDPTRYGINQEDSYGDNTIIRGNVISNCFTGILCGSYSALIEDNKIYSAENIGINLYTMFEGEVKNNLLWKCKSSIGVMSSHFANTHIEVSGNTIVGGNTSWPLPESDSYHAIFENNTFIDPLNVYFRDNDLVAFSNNHFKFNTYYTGVAAITISEMDNCTFFANGDTAKNITLKAERMRDCDFSNVILKLSGRNQATLREKVIMDNCSFNKSIISSEIASGKRVMLEINKGKLVDTIVKVSNVNTLENSITKIIDSEIFINTINYLTDMWNNNADCYGIVELEKCNIEISNSSLLYLVKNNYTVVQKTATTSLKDCNINHVGAGRLALLYYSHKLANREFISSRSIFSSNIDLPVRDAGIFIGYDPLKQATAEPSSGTFFVGDKRKNPSLILTNPMSWICVSTSGVPDDLPRIANKIAPSVSTVKVKGNQINTNGHVYECIVGGTTGSVEPTWSTSPGATIIDGNVTWKEVGYLAEFVTRYFN